MYYTYMIRCEDNSIYTGITTNIERRVAEHINKTDKCAKYTYWHNAIKLECAWTCENRALASKLEFNIKKLSKEEKEKLISEKTFFNTVFENKLECDKYNRYK